MAHFPTCLQGSEHIIASVILYPISFFKPYKVAIEATNFENALFDVSRLTPKTVFLHTKMT